MKFLHDHADSKPGKTAVKILLIFLIASVLTALLIVYLVNLLLAGT